MGKLSLHSCPPHMQTPTHTHTHAVNSLPPLTVFSLLAISVKPVLSSFYWVYPTLSWLPTWWYFLFSLQCGSFETAACNQAPFMNPLNNVNPPWCIFCNLRPCETWSQSSSHQSQINQQSALPYFLIIHLPFNPSFYLSRTILLNPLNPFPPLFLPSCPFLSISCVSEQ